MARSRREEWWALPRIGRTGDLTQRLTWVVAPGLTIVVLLSSPVIPQSHTGRAGASLAGTEPIMIECGRPRDQALRLANFFFRPAQPNSPTARLGI